MLASRTRTNNNLLPVKRFPRLIGLPGEYESLTRLSLTWSRFFSRSKGSAPGDINKEDSFYVFLLETPLKDPWNLVLHASVGGDIFLI